MVSRAWRKTLGKLGKFFAMFGALALGWAIFGAIIAAFMYYVLGITDPDPIFLASSLVPIVLSGGGFILWDVHRESKREVEHENWRMMRDLGDRR